MRIIQHWFSYIVVRMNILSVKKEPFNTNSTPIGRFLHDQQKLDLELNLNRLTDVDFLKLSFTFLVNIFFSIMVLTGRALFVPMNAHFVLSCIKQVRDRRYRNVHYFCYILYRWWQKWGTNLSHRWLITLQHRAHSGVISWKKTIKKKTENDYS